MKKILICGSREWKDKEFIRKIIHEEMPDEVIVGGCRGVDALAEKCCKEDGFKALVFTAQWKYFGKKAGPIRNRQMLSLKPDLVIAFHDDLSNSKGTLDIIREAIKRNISVKVIGKTDK